MVELLKDLPAHVAAYRATGRVSEEEYKQVVMRRVNEVAGQYGSINFLVLLETNMENYDLEAFLDYLKISFQHFSKWNRMAIVTNETWIRKAYDLLSMFVHGEIRGYTTEQFAEAREWVSAPVNLQVPIYKNAASAVFVSTSFMTAFSYILSKLRDSNFKEPLLLAKLMQRIIPSLKKPYSTIAGWVGHYSIGVVWTGLYAFLFKKRLMSPKLANSIPLGLMSGATAIIVWKTMFKLHPFPPQIPFKRYYGQLLTAHIIFTSICFFYFNNQQSYLAEADTKPFS